MSQSVQRPIFTLYEQWRIRNWSYAVAFAIFVPTGLRFAILAWKYGDWFDKPLSVIAGAVIGVIAGIMLLRVRPEPPQKTATAAAGPAIADAPAAAIPNASGLIAAARGQAAQNRRIAREAAALGSSRGWPFSS